MTPLIPLLPAVLLLFVAEAFVCTVEQVRAMIYGSA
jgi:hypothetical protein